MKRPVIVGETSKVVSSEKRVPGVEVKPKMAKKMQVKVKGLLPLKSRSKLVRRCNM